MISKAQDCFPMGIREWAGAKIVGPFFFKDFSRRIHGTGIFLPTVAARMNLMIGE